MWDTPKENQSRLCLSGIGWDRMAAGSAETGIIVTNVKQTENLQRKTGPNMKGEKYVIIKNNTDI